MNWQGESVSADPTLVLIGPTPPPLGGVSVHLARLSCQLARFGVRHCVLSSTATTGDDVIRPLGRHRLLSLLRVAPRLRNKAVIVHSSELHGLLSAILLKFFGARVAQFYHNGRALKRLGASKWKAYLGGLALRRLDRVYTVNTLIAEQVRALAGNGVAVEVLAAFLPPTQKELVANYLHNHIPASAKVIGWCGLTRGDRADIYGFDFFLELLLQINQKSVNVYGLVAASDGLDPSLLSSSDRVKLEALGDHLVLLATETPFVAVMQRLSLFLRPTSSDGDAVSIREALSLGVPVLASAVTPRPAGCDTYPFGDMENCLSKVIKLLEQKEKTRVIPAAKNLLTLDFSPEKAFDSLSRLIRHLQA